MIRNEARSDAERIYNNFKPRAATVVASGDEYVIVRLHADDVVSAHPYPSVISATPVGTAGALLRINREESIFIPIGIVLPGGESAILLVDGGAPDSVHDLSADGGSPGSVHDMNIDGGTP